MSSEMSVSQINGKEIYLPDGGFGRYWRDRNRR